MTSDEDLDRATKALNDLVCAAMELAETLPGDAEVTRHAGEIARRLRSRLSAPEPLSARDEP